MKLDRGQYFCMVLQGNYAERYGRTEFTCSKGDILFHPAHTEHSNQFTESATCLSLEMDSRWAQRFDELNGKLNMRGIIKTRDFYLQSLMHKIHFEMTYFDVSSGLVVEGLVLELLGLFLRQQPAENFSPVYLKKAVAYLEEYFWENPSLNEIARVSDISPEHLARAFKKRFRVTVGEYLRSLKIRNACRSLKCSSKTVREIALEAGFCDPGHFNRTFKKQMGITPLAFRERN